MPIEFRCTKCSKLLRTKDDTAGKQAKCPECGTVLMIPAAGSIAPPLADDDPLGFNDRGKEGREAGYTDSANPYRAPSSSAGAVAPLTAGAIVPTRFEISDVMGRSWKIFRGEMGLCIGVAMVGVVLVMAVNLGLLLLLMAQFGTDGQGRLPAGPNSLHTLVTNLFQLWITGGVVNFALHVARGTGANFAQLFSGGKWLVRLFFGQFLFYIIVLVGFICLIIPGIILSLMLSQYMYLIVDRDLGIVESLQTSREITRGNKGSLLVLGFLCTLIGFASLLTLGLALIIVLPWFMILMIVTYLTMTGQPTAEQRQPAYT